MINLNKNNSEKNVAVENAKVANVKYLYYHPGSKGFIDADGVVTCVVVAKVSVNLRDQVVTTILKDVKGNEYTRTGEFYLFDTAADFEDDVKSSDNKRYRISAGELLQWAGGDKTKNCDTPVIDYDEEKGTSNTYLNVWTYDNGQAVLTPVVINSVAWDENGKHVDDGEMPAAYWTSKAEVFKWNEYKLVDEDGDEFTEKGAEMRLAPTSAQQAAIKGIHAAFKAAFDAGLMVFVDFNGTIKAFNLDDIVVDDKNVDPQMLCGSTFNLADVTVTDANVDIHIGDDATFRFKPTARQLKQWKMNHPDA